MALKLWVTQSPPSYPLSMGWWHTLDFYFCLRHHLKENGSSQIQGKKFNLRQPKWLKWRAERMFTEVTNGPRAVCSLIPSPASFRRWWRTVCPISPRKFLSTVRHTVCTVPAPMCQLLKCLSSLLRIWHIYRSVALSSTCTIVYMHTFSRSPITVFCHGGRCCVWRLHSYPQSACDTSSQ